MSAEPCPYCSDGKRTGLPGNACENCMNTGLKYPSPCDNYEKSIREKVFNSGALTDGEWVYLVGVFQSAREYEEFQQERAAPSLS